jgi:hypothetical protein
MRQQKKMTEVGSISSGPYLGSLTASANSPHLRNTLSSLLPKEHPPPGLPPRPWAPSPHPRLPHYRPPCAQACEARPAKRQRAAGARRARLERAEPAADCGWAGGGTHLSSVITWKTCAGGNLLVPATPHSGKMLKGAGMGHGRRGVHRVEGELEAPELLRGELHVEVLADDGEDEHAEHHDGEGLGDDGQGGEERVDDGAQGAELVEEPKDAEDAHGAEHEDPLRPVGHRDADDGDCAGGGRGEGRTARLRVAAARPRAGGGGRQGGGGPITTAKSKRDHPDWTKGQNQLPNMLMTSSMAKI